MTEENKKQEDIHLTKGFTGWVHHHRMLAKWLMKFLVAGVASLLYYLRKEEKHIDEEATERRATTERERKKY